MKLIIYTVLHHEVGLVAQAAIHSAESDIKAFEAIDKQVGDMKWRDPEGDYVLEVREVEL